MNIGKFAGPLPLWPCDARRKLEKAFATAS